MDFKDSSRPIECGQIGPSILPIDCLLLIQWEKDGWLSALREQPSAPTRNLSGAMCIPALGGGFPKEGDQLSQFTQDFTGFATESATSQEISQSWTDWSWWVRSPCSQASAFNIKRLNQTWLLHSKDEQSQLFRLFDKKQKSRA